VLLGARVIARSLDELLVYQKSLILADAVSAILERPPLRKDWELRKQLAAASAAIPANIAEGFGQQTDRQFARYLFIARGSVHEVRAHLRVAYGRNYLSAEELATFSRTCDEVGKMLSALIRYLRVSDRKERG
jgi:four helix bundle protein